jgi:hypothetical protein
VQREQALEVGLVEPAERIDADVLDADPRLGLAVQAGRPCWARTSDQRIMRPENRDFLGLPEMSVFF